MIPHIIEFLVDYFTNLNIRKIIGGLLALIGMAIISRLGISGNPDTAVLYAVFGILIGGMGFVVIYLDIAKDKRDGNYDELGTLSKAYKENEFKKSKVIGWHMDQGSNDEIASQNKKNQE